MFQLKRQPAFFILIALLINSCAIYKEQFKKGIAQSVSADDRNAVHSFYFIGDAGNSDAGSSTAALQQFALALKDAGTNSSAVFLGDNIYPKGLPSKDHSDRGLAEQRLEAQLESLKNFDGRTFFIPGNHDWYGGGLKALKRQEKYIEKQEGQIDFYPEDGCPLKQVKINDKLVLLVIDSQWYLSNWDKHPTLNDDCEIKTRVKFFDEYESFLKKNEGKTVVVAIHHPMFSNGPHGGQYSLGQQIYPAKTIVPLPVIGSLINLVRKTGGVSRADMQNSRYLELKKRLVNLSQQSEKVIFVSGHEHSLQYLVQDNIPQIISGSGSKTSATRNVGPGIFSAGKSGFARLDVYADGSSSVHYFIAHENQSKPIFSSKVLRSDALPFSGNYAASFPKTKRASILNENETNKGKSYRFFWGERFRKDYSTPVEVPVVTLDTLFGGLRPIRRGGGHQSRSLRLEDEQGKQYIMRALRKSAVQYLQAVAFRDQYVEGQFDDTYTESLLTDVFTGAHPYAPFVTATLSKAVDVHHVDPVLYYVPKHDALGDYNRDYGDELYMIERRAASGHGDNKNFGFSNKIISTDDLLLKLRKNEGHVLDEASYVRVRLFDMLIGDWDRHEDQWRWATFKEDGQTVYRPVARDRDQAFSNMSDGAFMQVATRLVPGLRLMQSYENELRNAKWFNLEPYPLDMALINRTEKSVWDEQVKIIQNKLTDEVIEAAFAKMPKEVNQKALTEIKEKLKKRRAGLQNMGNAYYKHISKFAVITGTDKDDLFEVERMPEGQTRVTGYRIKKGEKGPQFHNRVYNSKETKEIWIYGLDDKDRFVVKGKGSKPLRVRIVGGLNNDTYTLENRRKVSLYDAKTKPNTLTGKGRIKRLNDYEINVYDYKKLKNSSNQLLPTIGFNPDQGLALGVRNTYTSFGFERNPFTAQHIISAQYFFGNSGYDLSYSGEFANVFPNWNFGFETRYTSPNFSINFFGFGNDTQNFDDDLSLDYNRVRIRQFKAAPSLIWRGELGGIFKVRATYENMEVERTPDRFISILGIGAREEVFEKQQFVGADASYVYENYDNTYFPTLGMKAALQVGWKMNAEDSDRNFTYLIPELAFDYRLVPNGRLVLATQIKGHLNFGDDFEFYQAASIGGNNGLRGYRFNRFTGKQAFFQNTDLRFNIRKLKTGVLPLDVGVFAGFDYGRVWSDIANESDALNTSVGGGLWLVAAETISARLSLFSSDDGLRFVFGFGFGF